MITYINIRIRILNLLKQEIKIQRDLLKQKVKRTET